MRHNSTDIFSLTRNETKAYRYSLIDQRWNKNLQTVVHCPENETQFQAFTNKKWDSHNSTDILLIDEGIEHNSAGKPMDTEDEEQLFKTKHRMRHKCTENETQLDKQD